MAEPPEIAVANRESDVYNFIARYRFSRSICHRLDKQVAPLLIDIRKTKLHVESNDEMDEIELMQANKSCPVSPIFRPKANGKSPSGPLSLLSSDGGYGSSSSTSTPSFHNSSSSYSLHSNTDSSDDPMDEVRRNNMKRGISWSQYFEYSDDSGREKPVEISEHWMVDMSQLFLGQKFATGTYSRLYHGIYKQKEVAVKILRPPDEDEEVAERLEREFQHEVSLLSRLHHPNIVQFLAACRRPPVYCVITEYQSRGSLRSFLHKRGPGSLSIKSVIKMALDIARGMEYLHSQGIIHRDLKSENLCLDDNLSVKITDFGGSCHYTECVHSTKETGTYRWMAPEMICHKQYSRKVDIYSFGIVLWELYTCLTPFEEMSAVQAAFAVVNKNTRPLIPPDCPLALGELMKQCWCFNPDKRPEFWEIVKRLEQFQELLQTDFSFTTWRNTSLHANLIFKCFTG